MATMTKETQQDLGALHFASVKLPCSAAELWQQVTLHLDNLHTEHIRVRIVYRKYGINPNIQNFRRLIFRALIWWRNRRKFPCFAVKEAPACEKLLRFGQDRHGSP